MRIKKLVQRGKAVVFDPLLCLKNLKNVYYLASNANGVTIKRKKEK